MEAQDKVNAEMLNELKSQLTPERLHSMLSDPNSPLAKALKEFRTHFSWDADKPDRDAPDVFHMEHCHYRSREHLMCFGHLYFMDDGSRVVSYIDDSTGENLNLNGTSSQTDALRLAFIGYCMAGLIRPISSSKLGPDAANTNAAG